MRFDSKEFGGRIRDLRKKKRITQEQLSIMLNVSANHLAKVETGSRCCSIELLQDLSSCLNVRTDYLLNGDAPHNNHLRERLTFLAQELERITQEQLSIMLNISANHLAKVETGSRCCSIELLQDLSSCLNVRTDYLLNGDAPHNNHLRERLTFLAQELEKITADLPVWG